MTMNVVVCGRPGELALERRDRPKRQPGEVLVRIRRVGVCGTDYHIFQGTQPYLDYPRVMGHELAGEVVEGDEAGRFLPGQAVCILPYLSCGECPTCRKGRGNCCPDLRVLGVHCDGGLAELLAVEARFVVDAAGISIDQAAMVEFLAIGRHAVVRGQVAAGERVLVVGAGPIGMAVTTFAVAEGADVTVLDGNAPRARFALDHLGADRAVIVDGDAPARLAQISGGAGFDAVFDATGNPKAMEAGFGQVAHAGRYVLVSIVKGDISFNDPEFHKREMTLMGSRNATIEDFAAVIAAIRAGRIPTRAMHTHSAPLSSLPDVFGKWIDPRSGVIKAIVEI